MTIITTKIYSDAKIKTYRCKAASFRETKLPPPNTRTTRQMSEMKNKDSNTNFHKTLEEPKTTAGEGSSTAKTNVIATDTSDVLTLVNPSASGTTTPIDEGFYVTNYYVRFLHYYVFSFYAHICTFRTLGSSRKCITIGK